MDSRHEEIARCLFRESNDALFIFDPKDHRVLDVNPAALRLTGLDKEAACALRLHELFTGAGPGALERLVDAYRRTGFYHSREGYRLARRSGGPIPVNVSVSRIHTAPEPMGLVVARDISERVRAQEALRASEARYRGLVEAAADIIWAVAPDGRIEALNPAFETITGWPVAAWLGRPITELVHPDDRPVAEDRFARALRGEAPPPYEIRIRSAGGEERVVEVHSAAHRSRGEPAGLAGIARDVTDRRRREEAVRQAEEMRRAKEAAEAADRTKSEFLSHVSHEIRTPLTAILGFTDLLLDDERVRALPAELLDGLRAIRQNGGHLLGLINDILDLTRVEAGRLRIDPGPQSPRLIAEDVAAGLRPRAEAGGLTLSLEVDPDVPAMIRTDALRIRQILFNLLSNAVKFTPSGGVRLRLRPGPAVDVGPSLIFEVIDTGVGMSGADLGRLFEPFYTAGAPLTREAGAGLGLAISRRLAGLLGGRIDVESRPGEGSHFTLTVPVAGPGPVETAGEATAAADASSAPGPDLPRPPSPGPLRGRVLLAEDHESIRQAVALRLQQLGVEVEVAGDGREAVERALAARDAGRPFDWILMDVQMPILDGYGATAELRRRGYRGAIIALTAYASAEDREDGLRIGCDDHLAKPIDWSRLAEVLEATRRRPGPIESPPRSDRDGHPDRRGPSLPGA